MGTSVADVIYNHIVCNLLIKAKHILTQKYYNVKIFLLKNYRNGSNPVEKVSFLTVFIPTAPKITPKK